MVTLEEDLKAHLERFHTAPFLFVGSGFSRRYLGLEDWQGLLRRFAAPTSRPYEYFRSSANGLLPAIATEIAKELHSIWWAAPEFADSRTRYSEDATTRESALKIEIARYLETVGTSVTTDPDLQAELALLQGVTIDGIVTTNWDLLLEHLFPDMEVYVGQDELLFSASHGVGEIYKIHGCCSNPNSLVATAADYERFEARNPYLAAKLLTVFAEHPIVFIGYSLNDPNISAILQSIAVCLTNDNIGQLRDRLILVRWDATAAAYRWEDSTIVAEGFPIPVKILVTNSFHDVFSCLAGLKRKFPAKVLRRLKQHVYELVHDNDPADRLHVVDIDSDADLSKIKVVYGVGLKVEGRSVRLSSDPAASPVRLSNDPDAPVLPFQAPPAEGAYTNLQEELGAMLRAWSADSQAYIARSRMRAFYAARKELQLSKDALRCLLVSAMHHGAPFHYWAHRLGRSDLIPMVREEIKLDLHPRIRAACRLAFAITMSDGADMLDQIKKGSRLVDVRHLAERLGNLLARVTTIYSEYRSPAKSIHHVGGEVIAIEIATLFEDPDKVERVLSHLATLSDPQSQARLKQLDAYFYGSRIT